MSTRTPDASILDAATRVLQSAKSIVSLREMRRQVVRELQEKDKDATVDPGRLRRLLALDPGVRLELRSRRGPKEKVLTKCPVCDARLERVKNQTLFGGEVTLTLRCPSCGYWTGKEKRIPTLYIFHYERSGAPRGGPSTAPDQPL